MSLRRGHGKGRGSPRVETRPWDEQPTPVAGASNPIAAGRDAAGRLCTSDAARAMARLPRRSRFVPRALACSPRFETHNRRRLEYLRRRRTELHNAWGGVSHGVGAMLAGAAWLWAAGELACELGAEQGEPKHFATATSLYAQAKQLEAAAWELGAREAQTRPASGSVDVAGRIAAMRREDERRRRDAEAEDAKVEASIDAALRRYELANGSPDLDDKTARLAEHFASLPAAELAECDACDRRSPRELPGCPFCGEADEASERPVDRTPSDGGSE